MKPMEIGEPPTHHNVVASHRHRAIRIFVPCGLVIVLVIFVISKSDQSLHETAATWRDHLVKGWNFEPQSSTVVWAGSDIGLSQKMLTKPNDNLRATFIHSVVKSNAATYRNDGLDYDLYVSLAMHVEAIPYHHDQWQIVSTDLSYLTTAIACTHVFAGQLFTVEGWQHFLTWSFVVNCPIPPQLAEAMAQNTGLVLHTKIAWTYKEDRGKFSHALSLKAHHPEPESEFGICLSPIWGHLNARATLEWRENVRRLGVDTVHWHARDASVAEWVRRYNSVTGAKDTFMYAPPTSLETYGHRKNLAENGLYGDQVRQIILDPDHAGLPSTGERIPPDPTILRTFLLDYFSNVSAELGSVCFARSYHAGKVDFDFSDVVPPQVASTPFPLLGYLKTWWPPARSHKCMHRVNGNEMASVNYGEAWYPGFSQIIYDNVTSSKLPFYLWHRPSDDAGPGVEPPYPPNELKQYIADLWIQRERTWARMRWKCDSLPCRF
ncbi:BZ3500_MvSof-1268-A1-R1_Chr1-3g01595 [Microbotryum saponariae]|uniref:BZ3500_MvSof-1268-A1-R1_Chr1-3g01595 protein n=1 Tax=Microbotryum saponariae TaxID=289078 RepID=A0A2X0MEV2_9BASI|nr:BZ3500_MvSof-1268-A1-R1_Chr1-3g01595 [Microbotryum saponariae]SCZ94102.1 BZ3501_MvSof-1269-A2-R1_Chr1-3g01196 [Microbotryum saponariae]